MKLEVLLFCLIGLAIIIFNSWVLKNKGYSFWRSFLISTFVIVMISYTVYKIINLEN